MCWECWCAAVVVASAWQSSWDARKVVVMVVVVVVMVVVVVSGWLLGRPHTTYPQLCVEAEIIRQ